MGGRSDKVRTGGHRITYKCITFNKHTHKRTENGDYFRAKYCNNNVSMEVGVVEDGIWKTLLEVMRSSYRLKEDFKHKQLSNNKKSHKQQDIEVKKLRVKKDKVIDKIKGLEELIVEKEIEKVGSREKAMSIGHKISLIQREHDKQSMILIGIENEISSLENSNLWVDWVKDYDRFIDESLTIPRKERIELIKKYIKKIDVSFDRDKKIHKFDLYFKLRLVNDILVYNNPDRIRDGYNIKDGNKDLTFELDTGVRNVREVGGLNGQN